MLFLAGVVQYVCVGGFASKRESRTYNPVYDLCSKNMTKNTLNIMFFGKGVIGHGNPIIPKRRELLNHLLLVYDGDRQAPPGSSNIFKRFRQMADPSRWLTCHISYGYPT
jgi:hypothetical protein